jgi:hypothetical protein
MSYITSGLAHTEYFETLIGSEYVTPLTDLKVLLSVDGTVSQDTIPLANSNGFKYQFPVLTVPNGQSKNVQFYVEADTVAGLFRVRRSLNVINVMDIPTDASSVRDLLGVTVDELPDDALHLESNYIKTYKSFTQAFHEDRLSDSRVTYLYAQYLRFYTALKVIPSLYLRLSKKDKTENGEFTRLADADNLSSLSNAIESDLQETIDQLDGYVLDSEVLIPTTVTFIDISPDRITGV